MSRPQPESETLNQIAQKHGFGEDAVAAALTALRAAHGRQAQFNHPELGGMGQWSSGGMLMIGDMFNTALKARVGALFADLSALPPPPIDEAEGAAAPDAPWLSSTGGRWPHELGSPSSTGSQNDMHYAVFPQTRRLAIERQGKTTVYDTGDHIISGAGQQQSGSQSLRFSSQLGSVDVANLPVVTSDTEPKAEVAARVETTVEAVKDERTAPTANGDQDHDAIIRKIESLHGLLQKGVLTQTEYDDKKRELLGRL